MPSTRGSRGCMTIASGTSMGRSVMQHSPSSRHSTRPGRHTSHPYSFHPHGAHVPSNRPLCRHDPEGAISPAERVRKLDASINVGLVGGWEVFGRPLHWAPEPTKMRADAHVCRGWDVLSLHA